MESFAKTTFCSSINRFFPNNELYLKISVECGIILVPKSDSIDFIPEKIDVLNHVILPTDKSNIYKTKTNKYIEIVNNTITLSTGFKNIGKSVQILDKFELFGLDPSLYHTNNTLTIYYISSPLEGNIISLTSIYTLDLKVLNQYISLLYMFPENETIFNDINKYIDKIMSLDIIHNNTIKIDFISTLIRNFCDIYTYSLTKTHSLLLSTRKGFKSTLIFYQSLESYFMNRLHDFVYTLLCIEKQYEVIIYNENINVIKSKPPDRSILTSQYVIDFSKSIDIIKFLKESRTPLEKIQIIIKFHNSISDELKNRFGFEINVSSEDFINIMQYVIINSIPYTSTILLDLYYIKYFHYQMIDKSEYANIFYNFENAVNTIYFYLSENPNTPLSDSQHKSGSFGIGSKQKVRNSLPSLSKSEMLIRYDNLFDSFIGYTTLSKSHTNKLDILYHSSVGGVNMDLFIPLKENIDSSLDRKYESIQNNYLSLEIKEVNTIKPIKSIKSVPTRLNNLDESNDEVEIYID